MEGVDLKFATLPLPAAMLEVSNTVTSCRVLFGGGTDLKMLLTLPLPALELQFCSGMYVVVVVIPQQSILRLTL